jgi:hypothetical protein
MCCQCARLSPGLITYYVFLGDRRPINRWDFDRLLAPKVRDKVLCPFVVSCPGSNTTIGPTVDRQGWRETTHCIPFLVFSLLSGGRSCRPSIRRKVLSKLLLVAVVFDHCTRGWNSAGIIAFSTVSDSFPPSSCSCCWISLSPKSYLTQNGFSSKSRTISTWVPASYETIPNRFYFLFVVT